jgi:CrcB protein
MRQSRFDPGRLAAIYAGGVIGALTRVGLAEAAPHGAATWPWATFAANLAGAFLLGYFVAAMRGHREESHGFALLTTGICGTLTTFATLQLELYEMLDAGSAGLAIGYLTATVLAGLLLVRAGLRIGSSHGSFLAHTTKKEPNAAGGGRGR